MSKKPRLRRTGRNDSEGRHVRLDHYLLKSIAWQSLDAVARAIYVEVKFRYNGSNNGRIPYSIREAADALGIGKTTAAKGFRALQVTGFLVAETRGHFDRKMRHASEWRLTEAACGLTGALATREFTRWQPPPGSKTQKPVPVRGPTVPQGEPFGTSGRTVILEKRRFGT
jgi:hypothetical protein